jgi:hypothetical protein
LKGCLACESLPKDKRSEVQRELFKAQQLLEKQEAEVSIAIIRKKGVNFQGVISNAIIISKV